MYFLLVLAVIYFGMRFLFRVVLPAYVAKNLKEMQNKMQDAQARYEEPTPEGEVKIVRDKQSGPKVGRESARPTDSSSSSSNGSASEDYLDFEEIDSEE